MNIKHNLKMLLSDLVGQVPEISELYLFGSRAYQTGSLRSDCDILVRVSAEKHVKASTLRDFSIERCRALDFFIAEDGKAVSCMNDSFVRAASFEALVVQLDAIQLWTLEHSFIEHVPVSWIFETAGNVEFELTALPNGSTSELSWQTLIKRAEQSGLPVRPYIGDNVDKATAMLVDVAQRMILKPDDLGPRGEARNGWTVNLKSEYDCQNLFFSVVKPWLPALAKEEVTVYYDDQKKIADFNAFDNQLIVELKFIDSNAKKSEVVKTLDGLARFYARNGNIRILLNLIFVKTGVDVDKYRWEKDYTHFKTSPRVLTHVIEVP